MAFDWEQYLEIARAHINEDANPMPSAKDRCAISRAYYAAFKTTHNYIGDSRSSVSSLDIGTGGDAHKRLPQWLKRQPSQDLRHIGELLIRLRKPRMRADYDNAEFQRAFDAAYNSVRDSYTVLQAISNKP